MGNTFGSHMDIDQTANMHPPTRRSAEGLIDAVMAQRARSWSLQCSTPCATMKPDMNMNETPVKNLCASSPELATRSRG